MRKLKEKPFFNYMTYPLERNKWNPLRYIFGKWTITHSLQKWVNQQNLDKKDVKIYENS